MITVNKANPTPGEITSSLTGSTGDGAGLHFDGAAGNIAGTTGLNLGSKYSAEFVLNYSGQSQSRLFDISGGGRVIIEFNRTGYTGKIVGYDSGWYEIADLFENDTTVHFVVTFDGTSVTAYVNGSQVGTATKNNSTEVTSSQFAVGSSIPVYGSRFNGTIYRARFYNKALTSAEVQTAYERADVDYADQYGSQTEKVANGGLENWNVANTVPDDWPVVTAGSSTVARSSDAASGSYSAQLSIDSNNSNVYINTSAVTLPAGKTVRYSVQMKGSAAIDGVAIYALGDNVTIDSPAVTTSYQTFTGTYTATADSRLLIGRLSTGNGNSKSIFVDNASVVQIGCVSDYDLAFANPTQSRMVQDRSGAADGTASTSGVTQVQPVVQLNATAARIGTSAGTPAAREVQLDKYLQFSDIYPQVVTSSTASEMTISGGNATSNGANIGLRGSTHGTPSSVRFRSGTTTTLTIDASGHVIVANMPTSSSGLASGTLYSDGGTIKIV